MGDLIRWHAMPAQEVLRLQHSRSEGLSPAEAVERLVEYGENSLPRAPRTRAVVVLLRQLKSPLIAWPKVSNPG